MPNYRKKNCAIKILKNTGKVILKKTRDKISTQIYYCLCYWFLRIQNGSSLRILIKLKDRYHTDDSKSLLNNYPIEIDNCESNTSDSDTETECPSD